MTIHLQCPRCHRLMQISEELIGKTGQMRKCPACGADLPATPAGQTPGGPTPQSQEAAAGASAAVTPEVLKAAMKAFRKRLRLAQLDEESNLGHGPFSPGSLSGIVAVRPPNQFPQAVWDQLVTQGLLRRSAAGLLELVDPPGKK